MSLGAMPARSHRWFIFDLKDKPAEHPPKNGMDSVSRGVVFLMQTPCGTFPYCRGNGHVGDSAMNQVGHEIWRCLEDNEGCWAWSEPGGASG